MKKLLLVCVFFLTCCAPVASPTPILPIVTPTPEVLTQPDLDAFKTSEQCPNICWLGMHVGTTTRQQAIDIFTKAPGNVNMRLTPRSLEGEWITDKEKKSKAFVAIHFTDDMVDSIMLGRMKPFTTSDFINLLGEPDKMWILWTDDRVGYGYRRTHYGLYYPEHKIEIQSGYSGVAETDWGGPLPNSKIEWVKIGVPPEHEEKYLQPWQGYGHLEEYRPNAVPTPAQ